MVIVRMNRPNLLTKSPQPPYRTLWHFFRQPPSYIPSLFLSLTLKLPVYRTGKRDKFKILLPYSVPSLNNCTILDLAKAFKRIISMPFERSGGKGRPMARMRPGHNTFLCGELGHATNHKLHFRLSQTHRRMQTILDSDVYLPIGSTVRKDSYLHDLNHGPRSAYSQVDRSVVLQNLGMFVEAGDAFRTSPHHYY